MTIALRYAARSDVGLLREENEDSAYAGPRVLAVADGMGGHAHGEVASSVAIAAVAGLDHGMADGDPVEVLNEVVQRANSLLQDMVQADPGLEGMGTTLTAMLWAGNQAALCHIGDSRAYLLRNGELFQITHDHTLVQTLVDEGRISPEEAITHPQRSLLLRALDGRSEAEPDLQLRETQVGDRYLLCSDGLSGVVSPATLYRILSTQPDLESAVRELIDEANRGGGPDNITCIVADVIDTSDGSPSPMTPVVAGAAASARNHGLRDLPPTEEAGPSLDGEESAGFDGNQEQERSPSVPSHEPRRRLGWTLGTLTLVLVALLAGAGYAGWRYAQGQYYVGAASGQVAIYRGINQSVAGYHLYTVHRRTEVAVSTLPSIHQLQVRETIPAANLPDAERIVAQLRAATSAAPRPPVPVKPQRPGGTGP